MLTTVTSLFSHSLILAAVLMAGSILGQPARAAETVAPEVATPSATVVSTPTARQQQWLSATPEQRVQLAEALGEDGARQFAKSKGWKPLMDGTKSTLRQGFDQVYRSADDIVHVVEAKGGSSQLARSYGYLQGSSEWAVKAAERTITSSTASAAEKDAAKAALRAARSGKLHVHVIRTKHVLGEPTVALLERTTQASDDAARLARTVVDDLAAWGIKVLDDVAAPSEDVARALGRMSDDAIKGAANVGDDVARAAAAAERSAGTVAKVARVASKVAIPIAVAVDVGLRVNEGTTIERRFAEGELTQQEREVSHAKNAAGMVGGWGGALAGAKLGAMGGGAAGSCVAPGPGTVIGGAAGAVVGGVVGYFGGEAAAETAAEWTVKKVHQAGTTISEAASTVGNACSGAWKWVFGD